MCEDIRGGPTKIWHGGLDNSIIDMKKQLDSSILD